MRLGRLLKLLALMFVFATIGNLFFANIAARQLYGDWTDGRRHVEEALGMIFVEDPSTLEVSQPHAVGPPTRRRFPVLKIAAVVIGGLWWLTRAAGN